MTSRAIPGWVVAFMPRGTIISTGAFVGRPGTADQKGLIWLVPHLLPPVVLIFAARFIVPHAWCAAG